MFEDVALDRPHLEGLLPRLASAERLKEDESYYPRVSNAGGCPRALTYSARGLEAKPHSGRMVLLFDDGNVHEEATIRWLEKSPFPVTERQLGVDVGRIPDAAGPHRDCNTCLREIRADVLHGHIDGLICTDNRTYLFEHKSISDFGFQKLSDEFPVGYITQCCAYLVGLKDLGIESDSVLLVMKNKNNSEYRQIFISYDFEHDVARVQNEWNGRVECFADVVAGLINLHALVERSRFFDANLPERPYDYDDWHCKVCRYKELCWTSFPDELKLRNTGVVLRETDPVSIQVMELCELRVREAEIKASIKDVRSGLNQALAQRGLKSGMAGNYKFGISAFKSTTVDDSLIPEEILQAAKKEYVRQTITIKRIEELNGI